jgi:osmotically-inducible protein OsmY
MKKASLVVSSLLFAAVCIASDSHEADRAIESTLRATLNDKHVHVNVHHGIVQLDGRVRTSDERARIESLVRNTTGVVAMRDELKVASPTPGTSPEFPSGVPVYTKSTEFPSAVPVYTKPAPEVITGTPVVRVPIPVIVPDFPRLKVEAWTTEDEPVANHVARQLRADAMPTDGLEDVRIVVRDGNVSVLGAIDSQSLHDDLISSLQRAGGARAIYDQLRIR